LRLLLTRYFCIRLKKQNLVNKDTKAYLGIPILGQLLSLFPRSIFNDSVTESDSDSAHRTVSTWAQFVYISYGVLTGSSSLREIYKNLEMLGDRISHLGLSEIPARSSISDANRSRESAVFGLFYMKLYKHFKGYLSDSYLKGLINGEVSPSQVHIFDSTTISLFKDIFKNTGRTPKNGQAKGGIKAFTKIILGERVPNFICLKAAATNEKLFLKSMELAKGTIAVFDKGFQKFTQYAEWTQAGVFFVTLLNENGKFKILKINPLEEIREDGVIQDAQIELSFYSKEEKQRKTVEVRMIAYIDPITGERFAFITNLFTLKAMTISLLYKNRWVIEPLFRQIKQNFELTYFLSDSQEGIKTQIWIAMILNLIFTAVYKMIGEALDFSTMVKLAAKNLYSYVNYIRFLKKPEILKRQKPQNHQKVQYNLFPKIDGG